MREKIKIEDKSGKNHQEASYYYIIIHLYNIP